MRLLQISGYDFPGDRFNGLAITPLLNELGVFSQHLVWEKNSQNPDLLEIEGYTRRALNRFISTFERTSSVQSMLYPHASSIIKMHAFQQVDVVHMHIMHSGFFSLWELKKITDLKPTVWTLHDSWAILVTVYICLSADVGRGWLW